MKIAVYLGAVMVVCLSCNSHNGGSKNKELLLTEITGNSNNIASNQDKCVPPFLREYISKELKQYIIPTTEDYVAGWKSFLENKTLPFLACGDFNGDNKFDYAMILIHKGFDKSELFVFNATDYGYLYFKLEEYDVFNKKIATVISIEKKGTWESVNETITVTNDGLLVELIEEGLGWSFYWDGQQYNKFLYD